MVVSPLHRVVPTRVAMEHVASFDGGEYGAPTMPRRWVDSLHDDGV